MGIEESIASRHEPCCTSKSAGSVSFVLPCLNEQRTLGLVLSKIKRICDCDLRDRRTEVIVCDNGSTDRSVEIAQQGGARVVHCDQRGYGAALQLGIHEATCEIVVFADADGTYDLLEAPRLVDALEGGGDLVIGSRLHGTIHKGAMPFLHRYLGTPVLTFLLNLLYARDGNKVADCNSGFRCFRRGAFQAWGVSSSGMEFASEMLIKALKSCARVSNVPVSLHPDMGGRVPHLQRWRDGMRHLIQIFVESPDFFFVTGCTLFFFSWLVILLGLFLGPVSLGFGVVFGLHSMLFGLLGSLFGVTLWSTGLFLSARAGARIRAYRYIIDLPEDKLFWRGVLASLGSVILLVAIVVHWAMRGFREIFIEEQTLAVVAFAANAMLLVSNVVTAHLLKASSHGFKCRLDSHSQGN